MCVFGTVKRRADPPEAHESLPDWGARVLAGYPCYGILLGLPGDNDARQYLISYRWELELLTGDDCQILVLCGNPNPIVDEAAWRREVDIHFGQEHLVRIADALDFRDQLPCLVVFRDHTFTKCYPVPLAGMSAEAIRKEIKSVISTIRSALSDGKDPINCIDASRRAQSMKDTRHSMVSKVVKVAPETVLRILSAWLEELLKR